MKKLKLSRREYFACEAMKAIIRKMPYVQVKADNMKPYISTARGAISYALALEKELDKAAPREHLP